MTTSQELGEAVLGGGHRVVAALTEHGGPRDRDAWLTVARECQTLVNSLTAVQDVALAEVARRESDWCEDGTLGETVHGPGRVTLDAADLAAPVLGASHAQAQRRVELAVRLAAGRVPVQADGREVPEASGLGRLHESMAAGHLDAYRAGVIAFELEVAPADVADAIVAALEGRLGDDAATLRRRTRVLLSRISPDLVRERAQRARASTGLRRWVSEPGVDAWFGTFPSEDAAAAWAAIDRLAHDLVADGTCSNVEQARGRALTDLVTGHATVDVQVALTVPADSTEASPTTTPTTTMPNGSDDDLVEVQGARPSEPLLVRRGWLRDHLARQAPEPHSSATQGRPPVACHPVTGARLDPHDHLATQAYRPGPELAALVRARDGRCRFPGCTVAARFCDLDHVRPWPAGHTAAPNLLTLCRRHHRVKQRPGWSVALHPDGTADWADPAGRTRTTAPLDALASLVLAADPADAPAPPDGTAPTQPWSALETHFTLRLEHHTGRPPDHDPWPHATHRRCPSVASLRAAITHRPALAQLPDLPPF